jgi:aminomethyltransferase
LLAFPRVGRAGFGARDTLRLEAGLCLSGADIDGTTSPVEAGLGWLVARKYRGAAAVPARFPGAARILRELSAGCARRLVGLAPAGRVPLRAGTALARADGTPAGRVTSGSFGPSAGRPVALGYVDQACAAPGTALVAEVRARAHAVAVVALPFVPHRYRRAAA